MNFRKKDKSIKNILWYTLVEVLLLIIVFSSVLLYIHSKAENDGYEYLHTETKEIKEQINLQIISDRENLQTMANLAAKLYQNGENFDLLFNSFKSIGLIEDIGILLNDNTFVAKVGTLDVKGVMSFEEEKEKYIYVSGLEKDVTNPENIVIRSCVPINSNGETIGMLYGIINAITFKLKYKTLADNKDSQLYIINRKTGNFLIDTWHVNLEHISFLKDREYKKGYTYQQLRSEINAGKGGYSSFESKVFDGVAYAHYSDMGIGDWQIMLIKPEDIVFRDAKFITQIFTIAFIFIIVIMLLYILIMVYTERKASYQNFISSEIRKLLLNINQQKGVIIEALNKISDFAKSRSAFFLDTDGEDYNFVSEKYSNKLLSDEDREYFMLSVLNYAGKINRDKNLSVNIFTIVADNELKKDDSAFYEFLIKNEISSITYSAITDKKNHASIIGVVNPKKKSEIENMLKDISICFSISIYNKKYLNQTEETAVTDSLTGLENRTSFKNLLEEKAFEKTKMLACVYIDVNELHIVNNKYGHAAGDAMLVYVADVLKEEFNKSRIFRMGGDEYLVLAENMSEDLISSVINNVNRKIEEMNYHISIGSEIYNGTDSIEELVKKAEKKMYDNKAEYYQYKERRNISEATMLEYEHIPTGINELDLTLKLLTMHYHGIYNVSLDEDKATRILMPSYMKPFVDSDEKYSNAFSYYIQKMVNPDYQRALLNFLKYDVIKKQLAEGHSPSITYEKIGGKKIILSVYPVPGSSNDVNNTIWIFEKAD